MSFDPSSMVGVGLAVLGVGAPTTVALLRLLPQKDSSACKEYVRSEVCSAKHEALQRSIDRIEKTLEQIWKAIRPSKTGD